jgi:hypothetical protein
MLDLQVELAGKILFPSLTNQCSFSGADVTPQGVREVMLFA